MRRFGPWLIALIACAAMIGLHAYTGEAGHVAVRPAAVGQSARLYGSTVVVNGWSIGQVLYSDDVFVGRTGVIYLAVNITVATDGAERSTSWAVGGESNGRTFAVDDPASVPEPGFRRTQDVVFELNPDNLAGFTVTFLDQAPIYAYDPQVNVNLGITPQAAADALDRARYDTVHATSGTPEVIR
jgi:hypothetical protein